MSKGPREEKTTTTTEVDARTQAFLDEFRRRSQGVLGAGGGADVFGEFGQFARQGLAGNIAVGNERGLTGIEAFLNPELENVVGGVQRDFDRQRDFATTRGQQQATQQRAFGGNRAAILESGLLGGVNRAETGTLAGLRANAFGNATSRLLNERSRLGGLGQQGLNNLFGLGQQLDQRQLAALQSMIPGLAGNTTTTQTQELAGGGFLPGLLGAGATIGGALIGGPAGAAIGNRLGGSFGRGRQAEGLPTAQDDLPAFNPLFEGGI